MDWQIHTYREIESTQDDVKDLAAMGLPEGIVIQALSQTEGRGRQGRVWQSPMGNLYMSVLLRPRCPAEKAGQVSFVVAVAIAAALDEFVAPDHALTLKWPNDILIDGKKCAGILIESTLGKEGIVEALSVGIGINVLAPPEDAVGLKDVSGGKQTPIHPLRDKVLAELDQAYNQWKHQGFAPIRARWLKQAHKAGDVITVRTGTAQFQARFRDMDDNGALLAEKDGGAVVTVTAAEIIV